MGNHQTHPQKLHPRLPLADPRHLNAANYPLPLHAPLRHHWLVRRNVRLLCLITICGYWYKVAHLRNRPLLRPQGPRASLGHAHGPRTPGESRERPIPHRLASRENMLGACLRYSGPSHRNQLECQKMGAGRQLRHRQRLGEACFLESSTGSAAWRSVGQREIGLKDSCLRPRLQHARLLLGHQQQGFLQEAAEQQQGSAVESK